MKPEIIVMNFTHVYEQERFLNNRRFRWIDCTDLNGTDCYCDTEAASAISRRIEPYSPHGLHFIDSGNYHYVSKLWTDKINEPFSMVLFDHHPDMQPSLFEEMLSCGSWVKNMLDTNPCLRKVLIVGAADKLIRSVPDEYKSRVKFYGESVMEHEEAWRSFSHEHVDEPVYISVDKDVLNKESAVTNWDQGSMSLNSLESLLTIILRNENVIGIDVCGECTPSLDLFDEQRSLNIDGKANKELLSLYCRIESAAASPAAH